MKQRIKITKVNRNQETKKVVKQSGVGLLEKYRGIRKKKLPSYMAGVCVTVFLTKERGFYFAEMKKWKLEEHQENQV